MGHQFKGFASHLLGHLQRRKTSQSQYFRDVTTVVDMARARGVRTNALWHHHQSGQSVIEGILPRFKLVCIAPPKKLLPGQLHIYLLPLRCGDCLRYEMP